LAACMPVTTMPTEPVPIQTAYLTNTIQPTFTPDPTFIPQPAVTRTPIPTFTPATPLANAQSYGLREWNADEADSLIAQIASQLDAVSGEPIYQGAYGWSYYMEQFKYLAFAEEEALLRFPNAAQATYWKWDLCYNLALSNQFAVSTDAPELPCYAKLIEDGLNSGQTSLSNLPNWFSIHESRFPFEMTPFDPPPGYTSSQIIMLENNASWLLMEKDGGFKATGLMSNMFYFRESESKVELLDLTSDNFPELVLYNSIRHCCGAWSAQFIYELSSGEPRQVGFENLSGVSSFVSSEYDSYITSLDAKKESPGLLFKGHYYGDPLTQPCHLRKYDKYYWINNQFELVDTWLGIDEPGKYDDMEFCKFVLDVAKESGEINVAVKTIADIQLGEPDVTRDQILYRLGEYHARLGEIKKAKEFFEDVLQIKSNDSASSWVAAAQVFLENYPDKNNYYGVCSKVTQCDMRAALQQLVSEIKPNDFLLAVEVLKNAGVQIKSNGFIDLDSDGNDEQWLVIQYPMRGQREFWILVEGSERVNGLFVAEISTNQPVLKQFQASNIYELTTVDGESLVSLEKLDFSDQPYILTHDSIENKNPLIEDDFLRHDLLVKKINDVANELLAGADPVEVRDTLTQLSQSQTFVCGDSNYYCDQLYYLLGLTYELSRDKQTVVDFYLRLWKEYPDSLYTIMARSKLELRP